MTLCHWRETDWEFCRSSLTDLLLHPVSNNTQCSVTSQSLDAYDKRLVFSLMKDLTERSEV